MTTNPFDFDHEDEAGAGPQDPSELLDRYRTPPMPDPNSVRVPDDPGELLEDEEEDEDPDEGMDDRESYSM